MPDSTPSRPAAQPTTTARLSLHLRDEGRAATTVATREHLHFQLDHALARDAVHTPLDTALLDCGLRERGLTPLLLRSNATDRSTYLRRPDLGRTLHPDSIATVQNAVISTEALTPPIISTEAPTPPVMSTGAPTPPVISTGGAPLRRSGENPVFRPAAELQPRILFLLADGLSALALEHHALPLLDAVLPLLEPGTLNLAPVPILANARVALGDPIGALFDAQITVLLIGERPGLSSPDSLGCYLTWNPRPGLTTDAQRNCISNIRGDDGLSYAEAAHRIAHYIREAERLQTTGIALKDPARPEIADRDTLQIPCSSQRDLIDKK